VISNGDTEVRDTNDATVAVRERPAGDLLAVGLEVLVGHGRREWALYSDVRV
jgi:hypothetical protein